MCHGYEPDWHAAEEDVDEEREAVEESDAPAFLEEEAAEDVELLTDGGDGDD